MVTAEELISAGRIWNAYVWINGDCAKRDEIIQNMNKYMINQTKFKVSRGIKDYDPVVRPARRYTIIAKDLDKETERNAGYFKRFLNNEVSLESLPRPLQELSLITCFAEVGRGYSSSLNTLIGWVWEIENGNSKWSDIKMEFDPSLTYSEDATGTMGEYKP